MVFIFEQFEFHAWRHLLPADFRQLDEARDVKERLQHEKQQQGHQDDRVHNGLFDAGDSGGDHAARHGRQQSKGESPFLALLGEKRLAQKQHHEQETQRK